MSIIVHPDDITKAKVVNMILNKKTVVCQTTVFLRNIFI